MAAPTVIVKIAFSTDPFATTPTWSTVSSDVLEIHIRRGRQHELDRIEAKPCTIVLDNSSGNYWPYNTGGLYYPDVLPGKRVNIRATYNNIYYERFVTGDDDKRACSDTDWGAQSFTPTTSHRITNVKLLLGRWSNPGIVTVSIKATDGSGHPTGTDLCSGRTNGDTLPTSAPWEWREIMLGNGYNLVANTKYAIVVRAAAAEAWWRFDSTATYTGGCQIGSADSGASWSNFAAYDFMFEDWGGSYPLYTGFVEAWQPDWLSRAGGRAPIIRVRCIGLTKNLARLLLNDGSGYSQEASGTRVGNVLDDLGWPAGDRDIDTGQSNMIATGALANVNAQDHLQLVQKSELGILFIAPDGDVQFQDRHCRLKSPYTTSQATFGDDAGEQSYQGIEPSYDDQFIYNDIRITRSGGTEQTASDATSQATYGKRSLSRTGLLMTADTEAKDQADYLKSRFKDVALRSRTLIVKPDKDPDSLYPKVLGYDISTRITVRLNQASIDEDYHIEGIRHDYVAKRGEWVTQWQLSGADSQVYWAIGVAGFSEIGETTRLAY